MAIQTFVATLAIRRTLESGYDRDRTVIMAETTEEAQAKLRKHMIHLFSEHEDIWYIGGQIESETLQSYRRCEVDYRTRPFETMNESIYGLSLHIDRLERDDEDVTHHNGRHWPTDKLISHLKQERDWQAHQFMARMTEDVLQKN